MRHLLLRLWREEGGFAAGPEWALIATILVLGAITGVVAVRQAALPEAREAPPGLVR
jgi:Flp pilus assembly pilin Flp